MFLIASVQKEPKYQQLTSVLIPDGDLLATSEIGSLKSAISILIPYSGIHFIYLWI